ncbi:MAG: hypothetical protein ACK528_12515 [Alphaproteobacteria bacterium]|jgi:hypothetical protein
MNESDSPQPVAWIAFATDGSESSAVYLLYEQARAAADEWNWDVAPLYAARQAMLTDEERSIVQACAELSEKAGITKAADTLRGLLKRLG